MNLRRISNPFHRNTIRRDEGPVGDMGGEGGGGSPTPATPPASGNDSPGVGGLTQQPAQSYTNGEVFSSPEQNARVQDIVSQGGSKKLSLSEIDDLLNFNVPFVAPPATPAATPKPNETAVAPASPPAAPAAPAEAPTPAPAAPPITAETIAAAAAKAAAEAIKAQQPTQPTQPQAPPAYYGEGGMEPALVINEQLAQAVFNAENPQQAHQALNIIINGVMNKVMADSGKMMGFALQHMQQQMQQQIPQVVQSQQIQATNTQKFFSKFAELSAPSFVPVVGAIAEAMRKAEPNIDPGSDDFLNRLGIAVHARLKQELGFDVPRKGAAAVVAPAAPPPPPQFQTRGGARPPAASPGSQSAGDLLSLVL